MLNSKTNFIGRVVGLEVNDYEYQDDVKGHQAGRTITLYVMADNDNPMACGVQVLTVKVADRGDLRNKIEGAVLPEHLTIADLKKIFLEKTVHVIQSFNAKYGRYRPEYISINKGD